MKTECCATCRYGKLHNDYEKSEPIICSNEESENAWDFRKPENACESYRNPGILKPSLQESAEVIRLGILEDRLLYKSFVSSIASALKEIPAGTGLYDIAEVVAGRIIGWEE